MQLARSSLLAGCAGVIGSVRKGDCAQPRRVRSPSWTRPTFGEDASRLILTLARTGMRKGELLAFEWVDYTHGELFVQRSQCKVTRTEKTTKTDDPRPVPVAEPLAVVLEEQRRWLIERSTPGSPWGWSSRLTQVTQRVARHVARSMTCVGPTRTSCQAGVSDRVRRSVAGWRTTQAIYAGVDHDERAAASKRMLALVQGGSKK